jgi:hypothetical protein
MPLGREVAERWAGTTNYPFADPSNIADRPRSKQSLHITVQLDPTSHNEKEYMRSYYQRMDVSVYWGSAEDFCEDLLDHWKAFNSAKS